jgi:5'-3' exonuclease
MSEPVYLVDASIYIFRAYYSIPDTFVSQDGEAVNAVYGYTNFMLDLLDRSPQYISFAFDESLNTCFRNRIYPEYKANRELPDENLTFQLAKCQEITDLLGFHHVSLHDYEADDIIGTLHKKLGGDRPVVIVTRDKDLGQLLRNDDLLWDFAADDYAGPSDVKEKFGVEPHQIVDYLALAGDSVDNIPGAPGIGAKSASKILNHFGDIDSLYFSIDEIETIGLRGAKKARETLLAHESNIRMFQELTRIHCEIDIDVALEDLAITPGKPELLASFCEEMKFGKRITERLLAVTGRG